jgi:ribosome modulation factor
MSEIFSAEFKPILLPNETATLFGSQFPKDGQPVRCRAVGALPEYVADFGSQTAGTWDRDNEDDNLEMASKELAQLRMRVLDNMRLQLKNPAAVQQWRTNNTNFYLRQFPNSGAWDPLKDFLFRASEFYVYEAITPRFDIYPYVTLTASKIWFGGWRFKLELITKAELTSKQEVWVDSWPTGN